MVEAVKTHHRKRKRQSRRRWIAGLLLVCFALAGVVLVIAIRNAEPILQARIVETLSTRFHSHVELTGLHVSITHGLRVSGEQLKIFDENDLNIHQPGIQPLITACT